MTRTALAVLGRGLVDPATPVLRADDHGVLRGDGLFETVRVCAGRPVLLDQHLARMALGAERLGLPLPSTVAWTELAEQALVASGAGDGMLKLVCTRGPEGGAPVAYAFVAPVPAATLIGRERGVDAITLTLGVAAGARNAAPWLLGGVKSTSYAVAMAAQREAISRGADDVIWLAADGTVLEGATSNVAWVSAGRLITPPNEVGILAGTTLAALCESTEVDVRHGHVDELRVADEVMLTSSVRGVAPVLSLDGVPVGAGKIGPTTAQLRAAYEELVTHA